MPDLVEITLALKNVRQFVSGTDQAAKGVKDIGDASEETTKKSSSALKTVGKWALSAGVIYGAQRAIRSSVSAAEDLAKSTLVVQRATGADAKTSSEWVSVAQSRGIQTTKLQTMFTKLSRNIASAQDGSKKSVALFKELGVSGQEIVKGDASPVMLRIADAVKGMTDPMRRAALVQQLFGKSGQAMLPLLMQGRKGIEDQMNMAAKYGDVMDQKGINRTKEMAAQQREMNMAINGVKVQLGEQLMPVILSVVKAFVGLLRVLNPILRNQTAMKIILGVMVTLWGAYTIATKAAAVAQALFGASLELSVGWIFLIIVALVALVVGLVYAYKHFKWFRDAINAAWSAIVTGARWVWGAMQRVFAWITHNWPLLATIIAGALMGPFGAAAVYIATHFGKVKAFVIGVVNDIKQAFNSLVEFVSNIPGRLLKSLTGGLHKAGGVAGKALGWGLSHVGLQHGGTVTRGGTVLVGEKGPELLSLPTAAQVMPLEGAVAGVGGATIVVPLYLDGREVARAVARATADRLARK